MNIAYLTDIIILLSAAVIAVPLFQSLGLGAIPGFLVAGIVLGPSGLGYIENYDEIAHLAELRGLTGKSMNVDWIMKTIVRTEVTPPARPLQAALTLPLQAYRGPAPGIPRGRVTRGSYGVSSPSS